MERVPTAIFLAFVSGCVNAWTLMNAGLFGTIMSGNTLTAIMGLVVGEFTHAIYALMVMVAFYFGAMLGGVLITFCVRRNITYAAIILGCEAILMSIGAILWGIGVIPATPIGAHYACMIFSFAAGMQGTAFHKEAGMLYGNVAITSVYQGFANFFGQALMAQTPQGREYNVDWLGRFGGVIVGFSGGAATLGLLGRAVGWTSTDLIPTPLSVTGWLMFIPAACVALMATLAFLETKRGVDPDPEPGDGKIY